MGMAGQPVMPTQPGYAPATMYTQTTPVDISAGATGANETAAFASHIPNASVEQPLNKQDDDGALQR